jgi:hypothetical protein
VDDVGLDLLLTKGVKLAASGVAPKQLELILSLGELSRPQRDRRTFGKIPIQTKAEAGLAQMSWIELVG